MIYEVLILDNGVTTTVLKINYHELGGTHGGFSDSHKLEM